MYRKKDGGGSSVLGVSSIKLRIKWGNDKMNYFPIKIQYLLSTGGVNTIPDDGWRLQG